MHIRYALAAVFLVMGQFLQAQPPVDPTNATDSKVKIHNGRRWKKPGVQAHATEHQGHSIQKQKPHRNRHPSGKEARVFKRQNHFAKREKNTRMRTRNARRSSLTRN